MHLRSGNWKHPSNSNPPSGSSRSSTVSRTQQRLEADARLALRIAEEAENTAVAKAEAAAARSAAANAVHRAELSAIESQRAASSRSSQVTSTRVSRVSRWVSDHALTTIHNSPLHKNPVLAAPDAANQRFAVDPYLPTSYFCPDTTAAIQLQACASVLAEASHTDAPLACQRSALPAGRPASLPAPGPTRVPYPAQAATEREFSMPADRLRGPVTTTSHFRPEPPRATLNPVYTPCYVRPVPTPDATHQVQHPLTPAVNPAYALPVPNTSQRYRPEPMQSQTLGTHQHDFYNRNILNERDTLSLARAVADVAVAAAKTGRNHVSPLPLFEGRPTDWLIFKKIYDETCPLFTHSENLVRISSALRGVARDCVSVLIAAAHDPTEVMSVLETSFARPEHIVLAEVAKLKSLPKLSGHEDAQELCTLACRVRNCTAVIRLLNRPEYLASPELSNEVVAKMTPLLRTRWADYATAREPGGHRLQWLSDFLCKEADLRAKYEVFVEPTSRRQSKPGISKESCHTTLATSVDGKTNVVCSFCKEVDHGVRTCRRFDNLTPADRWRWVREQKVCHKCLVRGGHRYAHCKKFSCKVHNCDRKGSHHTLLHEGRVAALPRTNVNTLVDEPLDTAAEVVNIHNNSSFPTKDYKVLLKVIPVTIRGPKGTVETFALLDDGSTATLMDNEVTRAIGATGVTKPMRLEAVGGLVKECTVDLVNVDIKGRQQDEWFQLKNVRSFPSLDLSHQTIKSRDIKPFPHLVNLAEGLCYEDAKPTVLIGVDHWHLTLARETRRGMPGQPAASLTALGWVIYGALKGKSNEDLNCVSNHLRAISENEPIANIDTQLKEYFHIDSIGISRIAHQSESDKFAVKMLESTTKRLCDGRFETGLLWKPQIADIPKTFDLAKSRFITLERKMTRDPTYAESYRQNIHAMFKKDYAELCEGESSGGVMWYLPHFGVMHPQKGKLRVVHDAAAMCRGTSLNSLLLPGPDLLQPLLAILMRFREGCVAMNGDIREMFPQTKIRREDRDAQRFLWRDDPSEPLRTYRMSSMMFGAVSSPFTALYLKNHNAEEHRALFPAAAEAIIRDHYMDDYLGSVDFVEEAQVLVADITHVHAQACLEMRAWVSNVPQALSCIPAESCAQNTSEVAVRVLGVNWNVKEDSFSFSRTNFSNPPTKLTKRSVLSHLMRVYDPLGLLVPLVIRGRILFQKTWKQSSDWDQDLPASVANEWGAWFKDCELLLDGSIPRHYFHHNILTHRPQLHIFADASELAYACVAYWRYQCDDGSTHLSLIGGKARVAPLKPVTIPRLELQAALCAARFSTYILDAHNIKPERTFLWTDSQTVLRWLRSEARSFKPFVAHRVGEITEITRVANWRYVPTALNVADDATRVEKCFDFAARWFTGPTFLTLPEPEWPSEPIHDPPMSNIELKRPFREIITAIHARTLPTPVVPDTTRFSSWSKLLRATARVVVAVKVFKSLLVPTRSICAEPTCEDICIAEQQLFLQSQLESMKDDYVRTTRGEAPAKDSPLRSLSVGVDSNTKLLHLSGRIGAVDTPISNSPIVLYGRNRIVQLLIAHYHERVAHSNNEIVVNELRQKYHVIGLRPAVKKVASSCLACRIRKAQTLTPPIGDLPEERLAHHMRPFTFVGLDYFGPIQVTVARHQEKRYVALFTCLTVRAVHLEVVTSLTTDSAIMALRRFIARRGAPTKLFSDNGTAFVGASRVLSAQPVLDFATNQKITWSFIPPSAPFMGGCWERLVGSIKTALSTTLHTRAPSDETLHTLLLEAESIVNSRPLSHVSVEPGEEEAITPFHFLLGSSSPHSVVGQQDDTDLDRRAKWKRGLRLADHFWARWVQEYLPLLVPRTRSAPSKSVNVGDIVFIADGNLPRGVWPRGRVSKTFPGRDGVVRVVEVNTQAGILRRPVRKLALLPN